MIGVGSPGADFLFRDLFSTITRGKPPSAADAAPVTAAKPAAHGNVIAEDRGSAPRH
jgi:hypothetical protein